MPTAFGKYQLQRKLAEGGMAEVFLAKQGGMEGFEKLVVLKRILPALSKEAEFVKMFLNEARVAARLSHPNVVQIFDLGRIDELYFIAMEYVHGEDLREVIKTAEERKAPAPHGLICRMMADTLAGLHYAHSRVGTDGKHLGLVHRDVSPANVIVTYDGGVKLVDFGIAKATRATSEQTQAGLFKGKFAYMSPEQSRGQPVDARSDVFSVGILLWELCTWKRLFKRPTEMATLISVAEEQIPSPSAVERSVPPELDRIVMKALRRPLDERYQTAQDMRADLEALIRTQRWEADALALERWMRQLFAPKLKAQEADIRAAGLASLEDFLLTVEEKTSISWMESNVSSAKKTPSIGLPPAAHPGLYDDGETVKVTDVMAETPPTAPPPPLESGPTLIAPDPSKNNRLPQPRTTSLKAAHPPLHKAGPDAKTSEAPNPPRHEAPLTVEAQNPAVAAAARARFAADNSTAKRPAIPGEPSRGKRLLIIISVAVVLAGIGLALVMWPAADPTPVVNPQVAPDEATLVITTDAPAIITVDGVASPLGLEATVTVKPGVPHTVTAQRPGKPAKSVYVPTVSAGQRLPLKVSVLR